MSVYSRIDNALKSQNDRINLSNMGLNSLPEELSDLRQLKTIDLSFNYLRRLPDYFVDFKQLEVVYLRQNSFKEIPEVLFELKNLRFINISFNKIEYIPSAISKLQKLEVLNISNNWLSATTKDLWKLSSLNMLILSHNELVSIPENIERSTNISSLRIGNNRIENIDNLIRSKSISELEIHNNRLDHLPLDIVNLKIRNLKINGNPFSLMPGLRDLKSVSKIYEYLRRRKYNQLEFSVEVNTKYHTLLKQYFRFLEDFVKSTMQEDIIVHLNSKDEVLFFYIECSKSVNEDLLIDKIKEYLDFAIKEDYTINYGDRKDINFKLTDLLILKLQNEVSHLKNGIRIANNEIRLLKMDSKIEEGSSVLNLISSTLPIRIGNGTTEILSKIRMEIRDSNLKEAIVLLLQNVDTQSPEYNEVIILNSRLSRCLVEKRLGILSRNDAELELNLISKSLLAIVDNI